MWRRPRTEKSWSSSQETFPLDNWGLQGNNSIKISVMSVAQQMEIGFWLPAGIRLSIVR
jgi:hypothetical protein